MPFYQQILVNSWQCMPFYQQFQGLKSAVHILLVQVSMKKQNFKLMRRKIGQAMYI